MLSADGDSSLINAFDFPFLQIWLYRIFSWAWHPIEIHKKKLTLLILRDYQFILFSLFWISWFFVFYAHRRHPAKMSSFVTTTLNRKNIKSIVLEFSSFCPSRLNVWSLSMSIGVKTSVNMSFENWVGVNGCAIVEGDLFLSARSSFFFFLSFFLSFSLSQIRALKSKILKRKSDVFGGVRGGPGGHRGGGKKNWKNEKTWKNMKNGKNEKMEKWKKHNVKWEKWKMKKKKEEHPHSYLQLRGLRYEFRFWLECDWPGSTSSANDD